MVMITLLNCLYVLCLNPYKYFMRLMVFMSDMLKEIETPCYLIMSFHKSADINIIKEARLC